MAKRPAVDHRAKQLRLLARRRSERDARNVALIESAVVLGVVLDAGLPVEMVVVETDRLSDVDEAVVDRAHRSGADVIEVGDGALASLVDAKSPQPVAAVVRRPTHSLTATLASATLVVVAVDLADPGNLGTIVRSAEAAGAHAVIAAGATVDPWSPKVVRSSAGGVFLVPVVAASVTEALAAVAGAGMLRFAADPSKGSSYDRASLLDPVAFVIGNEAHGLPADIDSSIDGWLHIPLLGRSESLNAAMAASILVFEAARQRRQKTHIT